MDTTSVTYGTPKDLSLNTFTKTGYTFKGWNAYRASDEKWFYKDPNNSNNNGWYMAGEQPSGYIKVVYSNSTSVSQTSAVDGDIVTMYAVWNIYTVQFNANGGTGSMANQTITYGLSEPLTANEFTLAGYTFTGWHAYRISDNKWYYTNGSSSGWYIEGQQLPGYTKVLYSNGNNVSQTTSADGDTVTMYAQWSTSTYGSFTYTVVNNQARIQSYTGTAATITIPATINGYSVLIDDGAFENNTALQTVTVSSGISYIGAGAFSNFTNLTSITLPSTLTQVEINPFYNCPNLTVCYSGNVIKGDVNNSSTVNVFDATLLEKYISNTSCTINYHAADLDTDGKITVDDLYFLNQYLLGA